MKISWKIAIFFWKSEVTENNLNFEKPINNESVIQLLNKIPFTVVMASVKQVYGVFLLYIITKFEYGRCDFLWISFKSNCGYIEHSFGLIEFELTVFDCILFTLSPSWIAIENIVVPAQTPHFKGGIWAGISLLWY